MKEKTLRDEIAMSMPEKALPELNDLETIYKVSEDLGIEFSEDPTKQIEWSLDFQAVIRYKYADAMLRARERKDI